MTEEDYKQDELVTVKLPRSDLEIIRNVIEREKAYNWITKTLKSTSVWVVAGGVLACIALWDKLLILLGMVK